MSETTPEPLRVDHLAVCAGRVIEQLSQAASGRVPHFTILIEDPEDDARVVMATNVGDDGARRMMLGAAKSEDRRIHNPDDPSFPR